MASYFSEPDFTKLSEEELKISLRAGLSNEARGVIASELVRKSLEKLNESTKESSRQEEKFSLSFLALAVFQIIIALFQFSFEVQNSSKQITGIILLILLAISFFYIFSKMRKIDSRKSKE